MLYLTVVYLQPMSQYIFKPKITALLNHNSRAHLSIHSLKGRIIFMGDDLAAEVVDLGPAEVNLNAKFV